jgi:UDP-N-acetylmuramoylalanine--D-glutamate ligase
MTERSRFSVRGARVTVVGGGRSGIAAAELLVRRGARVTLTDQQKAITDEQRLRKAGVSIDLGTDGAAAMSGADLIVLSPGVPPRQPAIEAARGAGVPVVGELELA